MRSAALFFTAPRLLLCLSLCLGSVLFSASATAGQRITVIQSIEAAFAYNPDLKAVQEGRQMAEHAVTKAKSGYLPRLSVYAGAGTSRLDDSTTRTYNEYDDFRGTADTRIRLTQPLWHGGATMAEVKTRTAQYESATAQLEDKGISLAFETIIAHTELALRQELVRLAKQNVAEHKKILGTTQQRYKANIATIGELKQIESRYARALATLAGYGTALDTAIANYKKITGKQVSNVTAAPLPRARYATIEDVREACLKGNRRIVAALTNVTAALSEKSLAHSAFLPRLDLEAGPTWSSIDRKGYRHSQELDAQVRLSWDIFNGGRDKASMAMAGAKIRQAKQQLYVLMDTLNSEIETVHSTIASSAVQVKEYDRAKKASVVTRRDYYQQFLSAQRSLIDVLDAENDYFFAASQYSVSQSTQVVSSYRLLAITGTLLQDLHINSTHMTDNTSTTSEKMPDLRDTPSQLAWPVRADSSHGNR